MLIDEDDFELVSKVRFIYCKLTASGYYACGQCFHPLTSKQTKSMHLHRLIMKCFDPKTQVDHINRNTLDNRKCNLRLCSKSQNNAWGVKRKDGVTSKYKGVCWTKKDGRWKAAICKNGKTVKQKLFKTEVEAALMYNIWAKELHGDFAALNIIEQPV